MGKNSQETAQVAQANVNNAQAVLTSVQSNPQTTLQTSLAATNKVTNSQATATQVTQYTTQVTTAAASIPTAPTSTHATEAATAATTALTNAVNALNDTIAGGGAGSGSTVSSGSGSGSGGCPGCAQESTLESLMAGSGTAIHAQTGNDHFDDTVPDGQASQAKADYQTKFNEVKTSLGSLFQLSAGGVGQLPSFDFGTIKGVHVVVDFNRFAAPLSIVGTSILFVSADLIHINTELAEGRLLMAGWFHWIPFRALVLMDEGQRIYPDRRDFKMESLDKFVCPAGYVIPEINVTINDDYTKQSYSVGRPEDVFTAFDMQRHYQWDIFISTTHINKIQKSIREVPQTAYLHKSLSGKLPFLFKDIWYEFQHDPENNGKSNAQRIGKPRKYKADRRIYQCYQSTVTGEHTESKADQSILGDSGVRIKLAAIVLAIGSSICLFINALDNHEALKIADPAPCSD